MKFGVILTGGPAREQVELARTAEEAGWDAVFTWDGIHVGDDIEVSDPWALMAAFAIATSRVRLGAIIHPLARRKPWEVARQSVTVDRLSNGRLVLPVGLGAVDDAGFGRVGEVTDRRIRAERLDESLQILEGLWSGEPFGFEGPSLPLRADGLPTHAGATPPDPGVGRRPVALGAIDAVRRPIRRIPAELGAGRPHPAGRRPGHAGVGRRALRRAGHRHRPGGHHVGRGSLGGRRARPSDGRGRRHMVD